MISSLETYIKPEQNLSSHLSTSLSRESVVSKPRTEALMTSWVRGKLAKKVAAEVA